MVGFLIASTLTWFAIALAIDIRGGPLALLVVEGLVEGDGLSIIQALESFSVDGRKVNKDVFAAVFWGDETVSLLGKELDGTGKFTVDLSGKSGIDRGRREGRGGGHKGEHSNGKRTHHDYSNVVIVGVIMICKNHDAPTASCVSQLVRVWWSGWWVVEDEKNVAMEQFRRGRPCGPWALKRNGRALGALKYRYGLLFGLKSQTTRTTLQHTTTSSSINDGEQRLIFGSQQEENSPCRRGIHAWSPPAVQIVVLSAFPSSGISSYRAKALEEVEVKTPQSWYRHGDLTMNYSTAPLVQKVEKIFEFDNKGQVVTMAQTHLINAWFWLDDYNDAPKGDDFCKAFRKDSYAQEIQERKRKLLQLEVRHVEGREQKRPALETKSSRLSASSFTADSKHMLEGDNDETVGESTHIQTINEFFQDKGDRYKLESMGETTGARSVQKDILDRLVKTGVFDKRITTKCEYNDGLPIADKARTLKDLDLGGGMTTSGSPPHGYFHTKTFSLQELGEREVNLLVTGIVKCQGSESSALCGAGEATALASNAAMALFKVGLPIDEIVIPIISLTGTQVQFAALYLLEPCFPVVCFLTTPLRLADESNTIAKYLCAMHDFTIQLERYIAATRGLPPRDPKQMELSAEKYYFKEMDQFFSTYINNESKEKSVNHFLRVTEKLQGSKAVCLPLTIRLGETKGGIQSKDIILFDMLNGYEIGFPDDEEDQKLLLKAICGAVSIVHSLGVIHMDLYLSKVMWKKLEDGSFDVKIIDFDAAQDRDARKLTDNVLKCLADREGDLLKLCGFKPTFKFDNVYLDMFQKNLDDERSA
eukprot:scaffold93667_cov48-Attheya_sp.AAC.1